MNPEIIFESPEFLVLNKPAGLLMHPLPNRADTEPTLAGWLKEHYPETGGVGDAPDLRPGLVHRLDRDTSGLVLIARTAEAYPELKTMFQARQVKKIYLALVRGHVEREKNVIRKPLGIISGTTRRSVRSAKMAKSALTEYSVLEKFSAPDGGFKSSLLEVRPHTGRTHQIRVHLVSIGHPVLGDRLYGQRLQPEWVPRLMLHALRLEFEWAGQAMNFCAEPDRAFAEALKSAGGKVRDFCG